MIRQQAWAHQESIIGDNLSLKVAAYVAEESPYYSVCTMALISRQDNASFSRPEVPPERLGLAAEKWSLTMLKEGFVPLPKRLLRSFHRIFVGQLGMEHFAAVMTVADYKRRNLTRLPSVEFLAFTAGLEPERLEQCLHELNQSGVVSIGFKEDSRQGRVVDVNLDPLDELVMRINANQ